VFCTCRWVVDDMLDHLLVLDFLCSAIDVAFLQG